MAKDATGVAIRYSIDMVYLDVKSGEIIGLYAQDDKFWLKPAFCEFHEISKTEFDEIVACVTGGIVALSENREKGIFKLENGVLDFIPRHGRSEDFECCKGETILGYTAFMDKYFNCRNQLN